MSRLLNRLIQWANNVLLVEVEFPMLMNPAVEVFPEGFAGDGDGVSRNQAVLEEEV